MLRVMLMVGSFALFGEALSTPRSISTARSLLKAPEVEQMSFVNASTSETLRKTYEQLPADSELAAQIALRVSRIMEHRRRFRDAVTWAKAAMSGSASIKIAARRMIARTTARDQCTVNRVGLLLPLSGEFGGVGREVLQGIKFALKDSGVELILFDTQGNAARASSGVLELTNKNKVCAILGPVGHLESSAAADAAEDLNVPLISLASKADLTEGRTFTFRYRLSYSDIAHAIAAYAMDSLDIQTFAILAPKTPYGHHMLRAFWRAVEARGGAIRGARTYDAKVPDFHTAIRGLIGRLHIEDVPISHHWRRLNRKNSRPGLHVPPRVDFEGIFIPDSGARLKRLLPYLSYWDIETRGARADASDLHHKYRGELPPSVYVFGGAQFLSGSTEVHPKEAHGAHFADMFWRDTTTGREFDDTWQEQYGQVPTRLAALGFAAGELLRPVIRGQFSRSRVRQSLLGRRQFPSIFGRGRIDSSGVIGVEPRILVFTPDIGPEPVTKPSKVED